MKALITGGCGFIGHHTVEHLIKNTDWEIVVLDKLTYASKGFDRLRDIKCYEDKRVKCLGHDISRPIVDGLAYEIGQVDYIIHMAAETHVDRSIVDARPFVRANVLGTLEVLEFARTQDNLKRFIYFSTDEVFGPACDADVKTLDGQPIKLSLKRHPICFKQSEYCEWDRYNSTNPYAATKAGGEELALAYANTHKVPVVVSHCMNAFGERQHPEKFVPIVIRKVLAGEKIYIHANPTKTQPGSRFWIHARNVADAVLTLCRYGQIRDKYNIVGNEVDNLSLVGLIAESIHKDYLFHYELVDFHSSRPGHDLRYALDGSKMEVLGWYPPVNFAESLVKTVQWYLENPRWLQEVWCNESKPDITFRQGEADALR